MSRVIADRTKETSTTTGTGTLDLDGAVDGFQGFVAAVGGGAEVYYTIVQQDPASNNEWETGIGTVTSGSPDTLSRDTVISSTESGDAKVTFSAGTKDVFISVPHTGGPVVVDSASPSGVASVDFSLPAGYMEFQLRGWVLSASDQVIYMRADDGGGFDSTDEYDWAASRVRKDFTANVGADGAAEMRITGDVKVESTGHGASVNIQILRALDAAQTQFSWRAGSENDIADQYTISGRGEHLVSSALTQVQLLFASGNVADGELRLIGIP